MSDAYVDVVFWAPSTHCVIPWSPRAMGHPASAFARCRAGACHHRRPPEPCGVGGGPKDTSSMCVVRLSVMYEVHRACLLRAARLPSRSCDHRS